MQPIFQISCQITYYRADLFFTFLTSVFSSSETSALENQWGFDKLVYQPTLIQFHIWQASMARKHAIDLKS